MATHTAAAAQSTAVPKMVHVGAIQRTVKYITDGAEIGGDTIQLLKVPDRATVHDGVLQISANFGVDAAVGISLGDGDDTGRFVSSATISATAVLSRFTGGIGYQYDISDAASPRHDTIDLTLTGGTASSSITVTLSVIYSVDA